ncbi:hypothetical protein ACF068_19810 [Streptomyces sp. NPDC016309]|uniref:hypothetical protein n=1 Tax=Streptomyces sp. NPDC016309 TaxID=3364965 RepID=UPI0036FA5CD9
MGASLLDVNLCGADLSNAVVQENSFQVRIDGNTVVNGLSGSVFGPVELAAEEGGVREIGGEALEEWLRARGANVRVVPRASARRAG